MIKRNKFRMSRKASQQSKLSSVQELPVLRDKLNLKLSPETQEYLKCRIGYEIFGDNNWVLVSKTAILASIEISNDFAAVLDYIDDYPEDKMLIGSYGFDQSISEEFQLCTTVEAKIQTLTDIAMRKKRIEQIYDMPVYPWSSLGSEIEVIGMQNFNLRSLLVVEIDSSFPIFVEKRIFTIREAKDSVYMECSTNRHEYKNIWRKRIDVGCQARAKQKNAFVQTRTSTNLNNYTDYQQPVSIETPNTNIDNKIAVFFDTCIDNVIDYLQINYHIHLHTNDYKDFKNPYIPQKYTNFKETVACQDIRECQGKQVSCVSWNPFISGIFAASYVRTNFYNVYSSQPSLKGVDTFDLNVALVWSFSNMQKPKLYLHSIRELTYISFCPYDGNIVVGGCNNGQIVVWDIRGQLSKVEIKENISQKQRANQMAIAKLVLWIKKLPSVGHVNPSVVSNLQYSHKTAITNISWIPPEHYISTTGQYRKSGEDNPHMQFVTSSLEDNSVLFWDLKHFRRPEKQVRKKPMHRLSKLPSALHKDDSPLKEKLSNFVPTFMLIVKDTISQTPIHITSLQLNNHKYNYEEEEAILVENNFKRIHFSLSPESVDYNCTQFLTVNTMSGLRYDCTWEGFTYDHGNEVNFDSCLLKVYAAVHDAPIKMCVVNRNEPDVLLSVGGKVFAVWNRKERTPILWRKCTSNYIFGKWSHAQPFEVLLFTYDGFIQLWNFFVNSKRPTFVMRSHGLPPTGIYSTVGVEHYIQNSILLSDQLGAIRVQTVGGRLADMSVQSFDQQESISTFIETQQQVQKCVAFWIERSKRTQCVVEPEEIKTETVHVPAVEETKKKQEAKNIISEMKEIFEKKQHRFMYERLTESKGIQLKQLEKDKIFLNEVLVQSNELSRKCAEALGNKQKIRLISWDAAKSDRRIYKISLSKDTANNLKRQYFESYLLLEEQFANNLKEYEYVFNWKQFKQCQLRSHL